ncbi:hypothetical protein AN396_12265 [Candidatus Epulonipiscium fishelsonii]|uniref:Uncharacterized protein n=1 Tax=Candidatus Epulonipiscium fishelsonii TaxID=77094 RepID=A0ACC8X7S8_9FIRM|nr:hypothetical protein AN396_12265 [Epulopiscium sp. SCG-B11WGA-EpuloA1]
MLETLKIRKDDSICKKTRIPLSKSLKEVINTYMRIFTEVKYINRLVLKQINKYGVYEASLKYIMTDANTMDTLVYCENIRGDLSIVKNLF